MVRMLEGKGLLGLILSRYENVSVKKMMISENDSSFFCQV
jgi:hypothetical protein